ncbi:MAG: hydroxymethylbilane synthase [Candidatus Omnitrophica bacterium]|nr:hydroxymethylbilane synthase [Candidatus Omnitrophota bacterium]
MSRTLRIGTRGSRLALYQAELVKSILDSHLPACRAELKVIKTSGDAGKNREADPFETKRVFTREIEQALLNGEIDLAVHSAKDLAVTLPRGLQLGAVLAREDARDCLLTPDGRKLRDLPQGARVGTSALRRIVQLKRLRPDLCIEPLRGNIDTRIAKMTAGGYDAIVLALAGLKRVDLTRHVSEIFEPEQFFPAPGQGAIVVECRSGDSGLVEALNLLHDPESGRRLLCERAFLRTLEGGCQLPCGIWTREEGEELFSSGVLFGTEGQEAVGADLEGPADDPEACGKKLAEVILESGGRRILEKIRKSGWGKQTS